MIRRAHVALLITAASGLVAPDLSLAQSPFLDSIAKDGSVTGRIVQMAAVLTFMSAMPAFLVMATSFTRFLIVFSFLRTGLGLHGAPANVVLIALSLFMTYHVMEPSIDKAWQDGGKPLLARTIGEEEAFRKIIAPFKDFMKAHVRDKDLRLFQDLALKTSRSGSDVDALDLKVIIPAFMVSELRKGFEIGFLIILPFLVIDLVVATIVMSMGMMMVSPAVFALPCKVLFFVLIDGWNLIVGSLVRSFL
jgi:flagellar biosynthetic protein FliP